MKQSKKIQKNIVALASELLKEQEIFCSWGAEEIKIDENAVSFLVSGFKFCGKICIIVNMGNSYKIILESPTHEKVIEDITLAKVVETIDNEVERTDNYVKSLLDCFF